jgi:nucleotide-binding universal stress UspA family protein
MYTHILVPIDGSATAERGLQEAVKLAAAHKAQLHVLTVIDDFPMLMQMSSEVNFRDTMARLRQIAEGQLDKARQTAEAAGVACDTRLCNVTHGRIGNVICDEAVKLGCDLIVMGTHGRRGFNRLALGSDAEQVTRISPVPVLLVRHADAAA